VYLVTRRVTKLLEERLSTFGILVKQFTLNELRAPNRLLSESITPTVVQYEMSKRWNDQIPQVSGSAMPMIQLPAPGT